MKLLSTTSATGVTVVTGFAATITGSSTVALRTGRVVVSAGRVSTGARDVSASRFGFASVSSCTRGTAVSAVDVVFVNDKSWPMALVLLSVMYTPARSIHDTDVRMRVFIGI
jgi:hypothetical protein